MKFIRSVKRIEPKHPNGKTIVYMHGYGGFTWQASRQLKVLKQEGYRIVALDFTYLLRLHDPQALVDLMDEVDAFLQKENLIRTNPLIIGISIGGLVGYNMMKRHAELTRLLVITGGNIALLPSTKSLRKHWNMTREQLTEKWQAVNMYTPVGTIKDRHIIMLLPLRDKIIDPDEVTAEIDLHRNLNDIQLIRTKGGHYRTIITETVLRPRKVLQLIHELE